MSVYIPTIPQPNDDISDSQGQLLDNFTALNATFGIDHITYADLTANKGKHDKVTTPNQAAHLATAADEPKFYAMKDAAWTNVPVIQYSRLGSSPVASPVSLIQSSAALINLPALATTPVFDATGTTRVFVKVYACNVAATGDDATFELPARCEAGAWQFNPSYSSSNLTMTSTGAVLNLRKGSGGAINIYWIVQVLRLE